MKWPTQWIRGAQGTFIKDLGVWTQVCGHHQNEGAMSVLWRAVLLFTETSTGWRSLWGSAKLSYFGFFLMANSSRNARICSRVFIFLLTINSRCSLFLRKKVMSSAVVTVRFAGKHLTLRHLSTELPRNVVILREHRQMIHILAILFHALSLILDNLSCRSSSIWFLILLTFSLFSCGW